MAINSFNSNSLPGVQQGFSSSYPLIQSSGVVSAPSLLNVTISPQQVLGLVPLYTCCNNTVITTPGSYGCVNFTIQLSGNIGGCALIFTFTDNTGIIINESVSFTTGETVSQAQTAIANAINSTGVYFATALPGGQITVCPDNPDAKNYWGATLRINCSTTSLGSVTLSGGCPKTLTMGTAPTTTVIANIKGCTDCREGKYTADLIPDDSDFGLTVFADPNSAGYITSDYNSWLLKYPTGYDAVNKGDFRLQQLIGGVWTTKTTLNNNNYGVPFNNNLGATKWPFYASSGASVGTFSTALASCSSNNYQGFFLDWRKVFNTYGAGTYRFYATGTIYSGGNAYCMATPPFCLSEYNCYNGDHTVKFESYYTGGNRGSVTTQGLYWSLNCNGSNPFFWLDSIRFNGFFGRNRPEIQRDQIKYATGIINKVRDEVIKNFELWISPMPQWFHERFSAYALMADQLFVTDANFNNPDYNFKHFWVAADSGYDPDYRFESRLSRIEGSVKFKEGQQLVFFDRC